MRISPDEDGSARAPASGRRLEKGLEIPAADDEGVEVFLLDDPGDLGRIAAVEVITEGELEMFRRKTCR
jgi:hypothetical protein